MISTRKSENRSGDETNRSDRDKKSVRDIYRHENWMRFLDELKMRVNKLRSRIFNPS